MDNKERANEPIANDGVELTDEKMDMVSGGGGLGNVFNTDPSKLDFANYAAIKTGHYEKLNKPY